MADGWINTLHGWAVCSRCGEKVHESYPHHFSNGITYCWDCAFVLEKITEEEFIQHCGVCTNNTHAAVSPDGKAVVWVGSSTPPWNKSDKDERSSPKYSSWRRSVFERDNYTCQDCGVRGGVLNAHHIKLFKSYKKLRFKVSNGITLCEKCHRNRHRKGGTASG